MSNLGQIVRSLGCSILLIFCAVPLSNAQDFKAVTKVTKDTLWLKWLPVDYTSLRKLTAGAQVSRVEVKSGEGLKALDYSNGKKWIIAPLQERFDVLNRNDSLQDRMATFLEPIVEAIPEADQNYFYGMAVIENVTHPELQYQLGNILVDIEFDRRKKYAYKISVANAEALYVYIDASVKSEFSAPEITLFLDKKETVVCSWDLRLTRDNAFAFDVEHAISNTSKSENLLNEPYLPFKSEFEINKHLAEIRHDNPMEGEMHYYRVVGRDAFGARSLFSEWKEIYVPAIISAYPIIDSVTVDAANRRVFGRIESATNKRRFEKMEILRSTKKDVGYEAIKTISLADGVNQFDIATNPGAISGDAYYYRISLTNEDDTVNSQPFYFFTLDQEPPNAPQGLDISIDSAGIARLKWTELEDPSLLGYRVFRANAKREEFMEQTHELVTTTYWSDTLPLDNLTSEIYYFIEGVDANFNQGAHSDTILGLKPDTIAPVAALIRTISKTELGIALEIITSTSEDADVTTLFRNAEMIGPISGDYLDSNLVPGTFYTYYLVTRDRSGNSSQSRSVSQKYEPGFREAPAGSVKADFQGNFIEIKYDLPDLEIYSVQIYRAKAGNPVRLWKTITDQKKRSIRDTSVSIGENYEYQIKYITKDGIHSLPLRLAVSF